MSAPILSETDPQVNSQNLDFLLNLPCHPIQHRILIELIAHVGEVVTRDALWRAAWGNDWPDDNNIYVQISTLRHKLPEWARIEAQYQTWYRPGGYKLVVQEQDSEAVA